MKKYSVRTEGGGAASNSVVDSLGRLLDAVVSGLDWGQQVIVTEIQTEERMETNKTSEV